MRQVVIKPLNRAANTKTILMHRAEDVVDGKPTFYFGGTLYGIDDIYKIRNMINSELDDAYVPVVIDPEDAA